MRISIISCVALLLGLSMGSATKTNETFHDMFESQSNWRNSKNIMFSSMYGGSSHVKWVLSILEELANRDHRVHFFTNDDQLGLAKDFPSIQSTSIGYQNPDKFKSLAYKGLVVEKLEYGVLKAVMTHQNDYYAEEYKAILNYIAENNIHAAICDHLASPCVEAAKTSNIAFTVTMSLAEGEGTMAPYINNEHYNLLSFTSESLSLKRRLLDFLYKPIEFKYHMRDVKKKRDQITEFLGLPKLSIKGHERWNHNLKLVNSAIGFEPARPFGPLVELIGPIIPRKHPIITPPIEEFLNKHSKVAYVAFGQHIVPPKEDTTLILTALIESLELGVIDGLIWASPKDFHGGTFPNAVTSTKNNTYLIPDFNDFNSTSHILRLDWAPQMAVLHHPSVDFFLTHGGAASIHEAMFAGVKLAIYPFVTDQPGNAIQMEKMGVGLKMRRDMSLKQVQDVIKKVTTDENNIFQANVNRFKALVHIKSRRGVKNGADIVEEVVFMQNEGKLPHRSDVKHNMSFLKANNYDLYGFITLFLLCLFKNVHCFASSIWSLRSRVPLKAKVHTD